MTRHALTALVVAAIALCAVGCGTTQPTARRVPGQRTTFQVTLPETTSEPTAPKVAAVSEESKRRAAEYERRDSFSQAIRTAVAQIRGFELDAAKETLAAATEMARSDRERRKVSSLQQLVKGAELFAAGKCAEARDIWRAIPSNALADEVRTRAEQVINFPVAVPPKT